MWCCLIHFLCIVSCDAHDKPYVHFSELETETQRSEVTWPRIHSQQRAQTEFEPRGSEPRSCSPEHHTACPGSQCKPWIKRFNSIGIVLGEDRNYNCVQKPYAHSYVPDKVARWPLKCDLVCGHSQGSSTNTSELAIILPANPFLGLFFSSPGEVFMGAVHSDGCYPKAPAFFPYVDCPAQRISVWKVAQKRSGKEGA